MLRIRAPSRASGAWAGSLLAAVDSCSSGRVSDGAGRSRGSQPGGLLEAGETHAEGARREIQEETGLVVEIDGLAAINEQRFVDTENDRSFRLCFAMFDATPTTTELAADPGLDGEDIHAVEWFDSLPETTYDDELYSRLFDRE